MARRGLDRARVVEEAVAIADAEGLSAVTLARVAAGLGVRSPSLYNHVEGLDGLVRGIAVRAVRELGDVLRHAAVGRAGSEAIVAMARAYRDYAHAHPGRYAASQLVPDGSDPDHVAAAEEVVGVMTAVLRAWRLEGDDAIHAVRGLRSALHGFVTLELAGGFGIPLDLDVSFERLVRTVAAGLGRP